ncbi:hypothetical protein B1218_34170, partial [Pseudomonas ogarae]
ARLGYPTPQTAEWDVATHHLLAAFQMHHRPTPFAGSPDPQPAPTPPLPHPPTHRRPPHPPRQPSTTSLNWR